MGTTLSAEELKLWLNQGDQEIACGWVSQSVKLLFGSKPTKSQIKEKVSSWKFKRTQSKLHARYKVLHCLCFLQSLVFMPSRSTDVCSPSPVAIDPPLPTTGVSPLSTIAVESLAPCNQRFSLLRLCLCVAFQNKWWAFNSSKTGAYLQTREGKTWSATAVFGPCRFTHSFFLFFSPLPCLSFK